jgi:hypothetical protein
VDAANVELAVPIIQEALLNRAFEDQGQSKAASALLVRVMPIMEGVKAGASSVKVREAVAGMVEAVAGRAVQGLDQAIQSKSAAAAVLGGLVKSLAARGGSSISEVS